MISSFHSWGYIQRKQNQRKKKGRLHPNSVQDSSVFLREKQPRYPLIDARRKKKKVVPVCKGILLNQEKKWKPVLQLHGWN